MYVMRWPFLLDNYLCFDILSKFYNTHGKADLLPILLPVEKVVTFAKVLARK